MKALIADDEPLLALSLRTALGEAWPELEIAAVVPNGLEAVQAAERLKPDVAFLDIRMPGMDGLEAAAEIADRLGEAAPAIVFVTAHDTYALRAFEAGALDYLLKPFDDARFHRALKRAKDRLASSMERESQPAQRLVVKNRGQVLFIDVADIEWIEAAGYYACLHVGTETHVMRRSLAELERDLGEGRFVRIHRSIIVNVERIHALEVRETGDYEVVLGSKVRLRLSRRFRKRLQDRIDATLIAR